jgi:hypothetical protein
MKFGLLDNMRTNCRVAKFAMLLTAGILFPTHAFAVIVNTLPIGVTVSPLPYSEVRSSNDSNTDIGNQSPANVKTALESTNWFNTPLTFVGGGACGIAPSFSNNCSAFSNGTKGGTSNLEANVFGVHYGNNFIAVLYSDVVSGFTIDGLRHDVSNIYAFNGSVSQVPLPAAFPLFLMALGMLGLTGWYRRKTRPAI